MTFMRIFVSVIFIITVGVSCISNKSSGEKQNNDYISSKIYPVTYCRTTAKILLYKDKDGFRNREETILQVGFKDGDEDREIFAIFFSSSNSNHVQIIPKNSTQALGNYIEIKEDSSYFLHVWEGFCR